MERHATRSARLRRAALARVVCGDRSAARIGGAPHRRTTPDEIAILKNTSEGLSFVAEGLRWNEGRQRRHDGARVPLELDAVEAARGTRRRVSRRGRCRRSTRSSRDSMNARASSPSRRSRFITVSPPTSTRSARCARVATCCFASTPSRASACCRSTCAARRSTSSPPTATNGCAAPRGRRSSTWRRKSASCSSRSRSAGRTSRARASSSAPAPSG
jgi:hypothetical protein